jgi:hypothetical protein
VPETFAYGALPKIAFINDVLPAPEGP